MTAVGTEAIRMIMGEDVARHRSRDPLVMADAAAWIVARDPRAFSGHLLTDEEVIGRAGGDLSSYLSAEAREAGGELAPSFFLPSPS